MYNSLSSTVFNIHSGHVLYMLLGNVWRIVALLIGSFHWYDSDLKNSAMFPCDLLIILLQTEGRATDVDYSFTFNSDIYYSAGK